MEPWEDIIFAIHQTIYHRHGDFHSFISTLNSIKTFEIEIEIYVYRIFFLGLDCSNARTKSIKLCVPFFAEEFHHEVIYIPKQYWPTTLTHTFVSLFPFFPFLSRSVPLNHSNGNRDLNTQNEQRPQNILCALFRCAHLVVDILIISSQALSLSPLPAWLLCVPSPWWLFYHISSSSSSCFYLSRECVVQNVSKLIYRQTWSAEGGGTHEPSSKSFDGHNQDNANNEILIPRRRERERER